MTYLPAPYESAQQDDLPAALAAGFTVTAAAIVGWVVGQQAYQASREIIDLIRAGIDGAQDLPPSLVMPTMGWVAGVVFLFFGSISLIFRRGRGTVIFAALLTIAATALAQFSYGYPDLVPVADPRVDQWPLFWGGVVVIAAALIPATARWCRKNTKPRGPSVTGSTESAARLWPGM